MAWRIHPGPVVDPPASAPAADGNKLPPLRSVHTTSFPALLRELGISLLVTTYQAKRLVLVRADGDRKNGLSLFLPIQSTARSA